MNRLKNIISFIYPVMMEARVGSITPYLEVMRYKGKNILNSQTVNYSYGGCQLIFSQLFKKINLKKFDFKKVLILGMGAGTIISLLKDNYKINCEITAIEKDDIVIELARKYFNIAKFNSLEIINEDAFNFTSETSNKYDLIISDLFIDGNVPKIFASNEYLQNLKKLLTNSGCIIYNKMTQSSDHKKEFIEFSEKFEAIFPGAATHKVSAYGTENSLLYFNTLPILIEEPNTLIKNTVNQGPVLGSLKPAFNYIKNVSFS